MNNEKNILESIKNEITINALEYIGKNENFDSLLKQIDTIINGNKYDFEKLFKSVSVDKQKEMSVLLRLYEGDYNQVMEVLKK